MRNKIATIGFFVLLTAISLISFGQKGFKVGIAMGSVIPLADFKSTNINSLNSGYAENGFMLNFDGDYFLHNRLAVSARFHFGMTSINEPAYIKRLESDLNGYLSADDEKNIYNINIWQWSAPMVGLKYNFPLVINKLYIEAGAFSGICFTQIPNQSLHIEDEVNQKAIISENIGERSTAIPVMADLALRFIANERMQFKIASSYFQSKADFLHANYIIKYNSTEVETELGNNNYSVPIKNLNLSIGLIYKL